jgi:hypothetical protein
VTRTSKAIAAATAAVAALVMSAGIEVAAGGDDDATTYAPNIEPARFTTEIDNPLFPLRPGTRWIYEGPVDGGTEHKVVEVTTETRPVMGVNCVVVHDLVHINGELHEDTVDWYAQDADGNVWNFGEATKKYDRGVASAQGSWEAGVDGAQPGIVMKNDPEAGDRYRQEYKRGEAEDTAQVLRTGEQVAVRFGSFDHVVVTKDFSPLDPGVVEHKYYAAGTGQVLEIDVQGGTDRIELIELTRPVS